VKSLNKGKIESAIASAVVCAVRFVNSFARCQHLFDIAAKPANVQAFSNFVRYMAEIWHTMRAPCIFIWPHTVSAGVANTQIHDAIVI